jgi:hypothetical protein
VKKISGTIAVIMIIVMIASSTSCLSYVFRSESVPVRVAFAVVDIVVFPISIIALLVYLLVTEAPDEMSQAYLVNAENNISKEYLFLINKIYSLPAAERASLRQTLASLPKTEQSSLLERINSLSETERASLISAYTSLPETEIISSITRINALSEAERVSLLEHFKSLSEEELASVVEELESLREESPYIAATDYSLQPAYAGLAFQY